MCGNMQCSASGHRARKDLRSTTAGVTTDGSLLPNMSVDKRATSSASGTA